MRTLEVCSFPGRVGFQVREEPEKLSFKQTSVGIPVFKKRINFCNKNKNFVKKNYRK